MNARPISPDLVIGATADYFHLTAEEVRSKRRIPYVLYARDIAVYLCRRLNGGMSYELLTHYFDYQDRSTLMASRKRITDRLGDELVKRQIQDIAALVMGRRS